MRFLIAYGSRHGGTAGLAEMIAANLREWGHAADVRDAHTVRDLTGYDVVVVGGALYCNRWHPHARRFVHRHQAALRERPVWLFSSGPLGDKTAAAGQLPVPQVATLARLVGAHGHATFGGRLTRNTRGLVARPMARYLAGDWRDPNQAYHWVRAILGDPALRAAVADESTDNQNCRSQAGRGASPVDPVRDA